MFDYVILKKTLDKEMIKNSFCASSEEIHIPLPILIFRSEILFLYFQIVGLPEI